MIKYEIEVYDSRNTSVPQVANRLLHLTSWRQTKASAQHLSKDNPWKVVAYDGEMTFAVYEQGKLTEWSS